MEDAVLIPLAGMHSSEIASLRRAVDVKIRNVEIRSRFRELTTGGMKASDALSELSMEYKIAESTIHKVIWPR